MTSSKPAAHYHAGSPATDDDHREVTRAHLGPEPDSGSLAWYYWHSARLFALGVTPHQELDRRPVPDEARDAVRGALRAHSATPRQPLQAVPALPAA